MHVQRNKPTCAKIAAQKGVLLAFSRWSDSVKRLVGLVTVSGFE
jgi:hypothetical protein